MSKTIMKFRPLLVAANEHLQKQAFTPATVKRYNQVWTDLANYMTRSGFDTYDGEVGQKFLTHLYGNFWRSRLSKSEKAVVRKIQYLNEFQEKGSVSARWRGPEISFKGEIGESMESFIRYRKDSGFSSNTLKNNRHYLHLFLTFMNSNGIDSLHSISPVHIVAFVESQEDVSLTTKYNMFGAIRNFLNIYIPISQIPLIYLQLSRRSTISGKQNYHRYILWKRYSRYWR